MNPLLDRRPGAVSGAARLSGRKARVHQILERPEECGTVARVVHGSLLALIALNAMAAILGTVQSFSDRLGNHLLYFDRISIAVFTGEYLLRVWSSPVDARYARPFFGRIRYAAIDRHHHFR